MKMLNVGQWSFKHETETQVYSYVGRKPEKERLVFNLNVNLVLAS